MSSNPVALGEILARHNWISTFTHPPDVASLLRNNDTPSLLQSARLKASLESLKTPLSELQSDLDLLRSAVASVESRMSCLLSLKHDYETVLSPIRRIPSEIMMEILHRAWKYNGSRLPMTLGRRLCGFNVFAIREGPWHLGQVCSSWRNVVETLCPELWANMSIEIPYHCKPKVSLKADAALEVLRIVLERSRNHPLDFYLEYNRPYSMEEDGIAQAMEQCFYMMVVHSNRWRTVEMTLDPYLLPRLSLIRGKIDGLRDVYIYCPDEDPESGNISAFEIAPKLERLDLRGMHPDADIRFPTTNLISFLDARPFGGDRLTLEYLDLVKSAPKLRSFSYNDYEYSQISTPMSFPRVMSRSVKELSTASPSFMR
ncbi:hypothetical protein EV421DRAFT_2016051, partial [Armillaria borealis]